MNSIVDKALVFAYNAHKGQVRKYTNEPYICHPIAVSAILEKHGYHDYVICAALLHDVVEDTYRTIEEVYNAFGTIIGNIVKSVTDVSKPSDGNRETRKAIDREHIKNSSALAKAVKLADLIDNTKSIVTYDKDFAKVYLEEKALLLDILKDGPELLHKEAYKVYTEAYNSLMFA